MANINHKTTAELREDLLNGQTAEAAALAKEGKLTARQRMALLFDEGTFVEVGAYVGRRRTELDSDADDSYEPVITGYGAIDGALVYAFSQDYSRLHGALGEMHAKKITNIIEMAERSEAPILGVFDSAGAKILEGVDALAGYGAIMRALDAVCVPKIAVVSGLCGGASAVIAEMFDLVIAADKTGKLFTSPSGKVAEGVSANPLMVDLHAEDDAAAMNAARTLVSYFTETTPDTDDANRAVALDGIFANDEYDVHDVIADVFDLGSFTELGGAHASQMVTGFATMNGRPVAVIANNPAVKGGKLCPCAVKKASKLLRIAFAQSMAVVTLVDTLGIADKPEAEEKGFAASLASLATGYARVGAGAVTVTLGKSFGTAYTVMGSKALTGGIALALDRAQIAAMAPESAVEFLGDVKDESRHAEIAADWAEKFASPLQAAKSGHIDDIIATAELRQRIGAALEMLAC